ncbi:MAG TPA: glucosaminidase domain-containing protein [Chitinophagales bacterium]|nr:glucosaminidase domain-containing protein [Chitinophagales bacterium]
MKRVLCLLLTPCCLLIAGIASAQTYDEQVEQYIAQYKAIAIEEMQRAHIPASITLAQGIVESSAGQSPLATKANNHFGIKCHEDWNGKVFYYNDDRKHECFRKYKTAAESFKDHSDFLTSKQRYAVLFTYDLCDYASWANGLKACGYATNPQYANILIKCVETYDLHQWDLNDEDRSKWFAQINKAESKSANDRQETKLNRDEVLESSGEKEQPQDRICVFNDIKCVTLQRGETLNDLATVFEIGINRLMRYNDITDQSQIQPGDRVYLQPKRHNGDESFHTVQIGESMFSMSRDHGIQLRELYEKNLLKEGDQPLQGEVIYMREKRLAPPKILDSVDQDQLELVTPTVAENSPDQFHVVSKGDTLYSVAKKYNMTVVELKELNHLYSENLYVGERLRVTK